MSRPRNKIIDAHAAIVYEIIPNDGQTPILTSRLAQLVPLTMPQVSAALRRLKYDGLIHNPNGRKTKHWVKTPAPEPEPEPEQDGSAAPPVDPRQLMLDLSMDSDSDSDPDPDPQTIEIECAEFERAMELLEAIAWHIGIDPRREES